MKKFIIQITFRLIYGSLELRTFSFGVYIGSIFFPRPTFCDFKFIGDKTKIPILS